MADEPEAQRPDEQEEDEGGPIKSFLEHLEDLRWVLIKSVAAAGVAMLGCLLAGNYVVRVLEWPMHRAPIGFHGSAKTQTVQLTFGTNRLAVLHPGTNDPLAQLTGTNQFSRLEIIPVTVGTNLILGVNVRSDPEAEEEALSGRRAIEIINLSPAGSFIVATKVAFFGGLVISAPFIFYFLAQFIFPALKMREKKYIYRGLAFGAGLFLAGVSFCYFILMPVALAASAQYAEWLGFAANQWRAEDYISFVCKFMVGMGLGFELPVVVLTLVKIGVLSHRALAAGRPYVIIICAVLGAILTTPEVITQVLMAIPLYCLYEISVWIAWYWDRRDKKREAAS
jgi:sec-independent protein translocase protein TatC